MYKKILFNTCLTEYCDHIFNFTLNLVQENDASLWIYYGLGKMEADQSKIAAAIQEAEEKISSAYVDRLRSHNITNYKINVSEGDLAGEIEKLAKNTGVDVMVMGTATHAPIAIGEDISITPLSSTAADIILMAPCPVLVLPPSQIPGLARG